MRMTLLATLSFAALALMPAACGDDDDDTAAHVDSTEEPGDDDKQDSELSSDTREGGSELESEIREALSELGAEERDGDTVVSIPDTVLFDFDQSELRDDASTVLDDVVEAVQYYADAPVKVHGHTDAEGSDSYNQTLSEDRAQAVLDYLVSGGVDSGRVSAEGFGETQPVADNNTEEGRAENRRVEIIIEGVQL